MSGQNRGDQAFRKDDLYGRWPEMTYGGAVSFLRRKYADDLISADHGFDIDCLDPAFVPGTGTPIAGGLTSAQALEIVRGLGALNLVGMNVVEVARPTMCLN